MGTFRCTLEDFTGLAQNRRHHVAMPSIADCRVVRTCGTSFMLPIGRKEDGANDQR